MASHALPQHARRVARRNGLLQLGQLHFWLLAGTLGGMLALVAMVFLIHLSSL